MTRALRSARPGLGSRRTPALPSLLQPRPGVSPQASHSGRADGLCRLPPGVPARPGLRPSLSLGARHRSGARCWPPAPRRGPAAARRPLRRTRSEPGLCPPALWPALVVARDFSGGLRLGGPSPEPSAWLRAVCARGAALTSSARMDGSLLLPFSCSARPEAGVRREEHTPTGGERRRRPRQLRGGHFRPICARDGRGWGADPLRTP